MNDFKAGVVAAGLLLSLWLILGQALDVSAEEVRGLAQARTGGSSGGSQGGSSGNAGGSGKEPRIQYPKKTEMSFDGAQIEGEIQNPGEFYFQHRPEEKFDSLVKRRKNFHREMMRDVVFSK